MEQILPVPWLVMVAINCVLSIPKVVVVVVNLPVLHLTKLQLHLVQLQVAQQEFRVLLLPGRLNK